MAPELLSGCDPTNAAEFAANGYYFGKHLHQELGVPVGLIHDCVSGTPGEAWASPETIADPAYQELVDSFRRNHPKWVEANDKFQRAIDAWRSANRQWNANVGARIHEAKSGLGVPRHGSLCSSVTASISL